MTIRSHLFSAHVATLAGAVLSFTTLQAGEFEDLFATFGIIETVAGDGKGEDRTNKWREAMEGASATQVSLSRPHMAMQDAAGNIYIADKEAHGIRKVTPDGKIRTVVGTGELGNGGEGLGTEVALDNPNGLYTFPDGTTYVLDVGNNTIRVLSPDGQVTTVLTDSGGLGIGRALWVSADRKLIYYSGPGSIRRWREAEGIDTYATGFSQLGNIDVNADGVVYAADRFSHRVYRVPEGGPLEPVAGDGSTDSGTDGTALGTPLNEVRAIAFEPSTGGYYVGTHRGSQIWYVDTDGSIHLMIDGDRDDDTHSGDGRPVQEPGEKISEPRAITVAPNGDLLITENDNGFIRRVRKLPSAPKQALRVLETKFSGNGFLLHWESDPAQRYRVEHSTEFTDGWQTLIELPGTAGSTSTSHTDPAAIERRSGFYRVQQLD